MARLRSLVVRIRRSVSRVVRMLAGTDVARGAAEALRRGVAALPLPESLRNRLGMLRIRPGSTRVEWDRLLLGGQCRRTAAQFAEDTGWFLWPSTRLVDGPHAELLSGVREGAIDPDDVEVLRATRYADLARTCVELYGDYFGARTSGEIDDLLKEIAHGEIGRDRPGRSDGGKRSERLPRVRPVRHSDCYEVVDGHHRLALAWAEGAAPPRVLVDWVGAHTPLQELLLRMSWLDGSREVYQPLDAPELEARWPLVRACTDRWERIEAFLAEVGMTELEGVSYLDVAAAQGWFVNQMHRRGADATGVERDPLGPELAHRVYGLPPERIVTADAVEFLRGAKRRWDVVSCFSLVHHFALGRGSVDGEELIRLLGTVTGKVLFFDTGEAHEQWFTGRLDGWDADGIEQRLRDHGGFDEVHRLGRDGDGVGPYAGNYGRMLFACVRA